MKKIMLTYAPGDLSAKIKNRYKYRFEDVVPLTMRACNDLGYMAAALKQCGHEVFLRDYKIEKATALDFLDDILTFNPDVIVISTSNINLVEDLKIIRMIKSSNPEITIILKSELFFNPSDEILNNLPMSGVDYAIGSDAAFVLPKLIDAHFANSGEVSDIPFIIIFKNGQAYKNNFDAQGGDINSLPLPERSLMKNEYYYRPDNKEVIATIITGKGCNSDYLHCGEAQLAGLRIRTPENVIEEILDCYKNYGIRNFFFPSDTFSNDEKWIERLCDLMKENNITQDIDWIAVVNPAKFTEYMASQMKSAGCSMLIIRFEAGSEESLMRSKCGFSADECYNTAEIAQKTKLKIFGLFTMGFPWEEESHIIETRNMINKICPDYLSLSFPVPFPGSEIEKIYRQDNILKDDLVANNVIKIPALGTKFISHKVLKGLRRSILLRYYLNPKLLLKKLKEISKNPSEFMNYIKSARDVVKKR